MKLLHSMFLGFGLSFALLSIISVEVSPERAALYALLGLTALVIVQKSVSHV